MLWWVTLAVLWLVATAADRHWLALDRGLPSWDQADYLNSAMDHGRALGLLPGGGWAGWEALLDLSPKIPPLASLVNGTVMAITGDSPDQASGSLAVWHALLLVSVALWGRDLLDRRFGLLAAGLTSLTPALAELRVDYTLDLPLAASTTLALWLLGRWQAPGPRGGHWRQSLPAALAIAAAILVKQSALLVVALPSLWAAVGGLRQRGRRWQVLAALAVIVGLSLPWLKHNWITTLGGTNRAVLESAQAEGDPPALSLASLVWYPRLWPSQLGGVTVLGGMAGSLLGIRGGALAGLRLPALPLAERLRRPLDSLPPGWAWLIGCTLGGWLCTTLSPNKDARYIAPVLPLLVLLLTRGWWQVGLWLKKRWGAMLPGALLAAGLVSGAGTLVTARSAAITWGREAPVAGVIADLRRRVGDAPTTLVMVPGDPQLNEQNVTTFGRMDGGRIEARRLGRRRGEHPLVLERSEWILLATGDQGTNRPFSRELSHRVRSDGRFERVRSWPWSEGREVELWHRRPVGAPGALPAQRFDEEFIALARGMASGPRGLKRLFDRIGPEHQLDASFQYQRRVRDWAERRLTRDPHDTDALWSLALIATLRNRPAEAEGWYARLQQELPDNPWPRAYRAVVLLAAWNPAAAHRVLASSPAEGEGAPVLRGLGDLSALLSGHPGAVGALRRSLPEAIEAVKSNLAGS